MMDNELQLGRNVGYLVDDLKVCSRAELAAALGVSVTNIGMLIRGDTKGLRPLNLVRAAKRLQVTVESLVLDDLKALSIEYAPLMAGRYTYSFDFLGVSESGLAMEDRAAVEKALITWSALIRSGSKEAVRIAKAIISLTS